MNDSHRPHFLQRLFGQFSWKPPQWLRAADGNRLSRAKLAGFLALLVALGGGVSLYGLWEPTARERIVGAVSAPAIAHYRAQSDQLHPQPLSIAFLQSVAPIDMVGKKMEEGIAMEPAIAGEWRWQSESNLTFQPEQEWPAGQGFSVVLGQNVLRTSIGEIERRYEFSTQPFKVAVEALRYVQSPVDAEVKEVAATLRFSYPVDEGSLKKYLKVRMLGDDGLWSTSEDSLSIKFAERGRQVFLRRSLQGLPEKTDYAEVTLPASIASARGMRLSESVQERVALPSRYDFFRIEEIEGAIVRDEQNEPEQILRVISRGEVRGEVLDRNLRAFVLPKFHPKIARDEQPDQGYRWSGPAQVDAEVLAASKRVVLERVPAEKDFADVHHWKFHLPEPGLLFVQINRGVEAWGGYVLGETRRELLRSPAYPREVEILGKGGILALGGEKKLALKSRGIGAVHCRMGRVRTQQIQHLVSQTQGDFQNPVFRQRYLFNEQNLAAISTEVQRVHMVSPAQAQYFSVDFGEIMAQGDSEQDDLRGLFFFEARGWSEQSKSYLTEKASRFILITDLGLISKMNRDGSSEVFVLSLQSGEPLAGVSVALIGLNGFPLAEAVSDVSGRVSFPPLEEATGQREPVAYVATWGDDVSFLTYRRRDRELSFARFDVAGYWEQHPDELEGFLFTERGIYRPGETVHGALSVRRRDWSGGLEGFPVKISIYDSKHQRVHEEVFALPESGFFDFEFATREAAPTGTYFAQAHLVREGNQIETHLGRVEFALKPFQPDRLQLSSEVVGAPSRGWAFPDEIAGQVALRNLFGSPLVDAKVKGRIVLTPQNFHFSQYPDYRFHDPGRNPDKPPQSVTLDLGEQKTDAEGRVEFSFPLEELGAATFGLQFEAEGFEPESGRSVKARAQALISTLPYVLGYKADGDLHFIREGTAREIEWLALDPELTPVDVPDLTLRTLELTQVSVLQKKPNGDYAYESVPREKEIAVSSLDVNADGGALSAIASDRPGRYAFEVWEGEGMETRLARVSFTVVGQGRMDRSLERNAELEVQLPQKTFQAGEEVEVHLVAPYHGAGLITLERGQVVSHHWFQTQGNSSVEKIRIPDDLEGTYYLNVAFVRDIASQEIFTSPLSYAVVPLEVRDTDRDIAIDFRLPEKTDPHESFTIGYRAERPCQMVVYAVDEGVLQITNYRTPNPLAHVFRKVALMVRTTQLLDLLLPEFSIFKQLAATGGGGEMAAAPSLLLNPFAREIKESVVFWSGVVEAGPEWRELSYDVPDHFNGALRVMAVAVAADGVGSSERKVVLRSPIVLTPTWPTFMAPGDRSTVALRVTNLLEGIEEALELELSLKCSEHLRVVEGATQKISLKPEEEGRVSFVVEAGDQLGSAELHFQVQGGGKDFTLRETLSVRPAVPFSTEVRSGRVGRKPVEVAVEGDYYPEFRRLEASLSALPMGLARGLDRYLDDYPYGCSEQIASAAFARLLLAEEADFGLSRAEAAEQLNQVWEQLRGRQNGRGAFGYWAAQESAGIDWITVYVCHLMTEAMNAGFAVPGEMMARGLRNVEGMLENVPSTLEEARTLAYAIYVLTLNEKVTTNYLLHFEELLEARPDLVELRDDFSRCYLAGALALLKKEESGGAHLRAVKISGEEADDFAQPLAQLAQVQAIVARHFPERIEKKAWDQLFEQLAQREANTISSAYAIWALKNYTQRRDPIVLRIAEIDGEKDRVLAEDMGTLLEFSFSDEVANLQFSAKGNESPLGSFYQITTAGFSRDFPEEAVARGIEVLREWVDSEGNPVTRLSVGQPITAVVKFRSRQKRPVTNVAIVDLLPAGFEILRDSLAVGQSNVPGVDFVDLREDRVIFFVTAGEKMGEVRYQVKPTTAGKFVVPPLLGHSMYRPEMKAGGVARSVEVVAP